jgi:hypothetical protein
MRFVHFFREMRTHTHKCSYDCGMKTLTYVFADGNFVVQDDDEEKELAETEDEDLLDDELDVVT